MRRILPVFLALLLPAAAPASAGAWELRVCAEPNNMPFSREDGAGFENAIARLLAEELGADLVQVWLPQPQARALSALMREGQCDLVAGLAEGHGAFLTTHAYYRSSFVFVQRHDAPFTIASFDDPALSELSIGVHYSGEHTSPPVQALVNRSLQENISPFGRNKGDADPLAAMIDAVAEGQIDLAIAWGPVGGYFAQRHDVKLDVTPVSPQIALPFVPMVFPIAMGVRPGDVALRDRIDLAIARRWDEIQSILAEFDVPRLDMPRPEPAMEER